MANSDAGRAVLNGSYQCPEGTDEGTIDLFWEISHICSIVPKDLVNTSFTRQRWVDHWRTKKEKTSSSELGLHFGHYKAGQRLYPDMML